MHRLITSPSEALAAACVGHSAYSQTFPCAPSTAGIGRERVRDVLAMWRLDSLAEPATLIVTELIANAARHTPCHEIRLVIVRPTATRVRVGIVDRRPLCLPRLGQTGDEEETGRGLLLIDAVADRWGYDLIGPGTRPLAKEVWAELRTKEGE
ncbi:ATP-binding protein [Streptomyces sp. NPDC058739]|uniref:ATP-binding protein n=1 Tax=Streptomyces sp. NPDC058739 TaxID=3346618 RepID=UPI0036C6439E